SHSPEQPTIGSSNIDPPGTQLSIRFPAHLGRKVKRSPCVDIAMYVSNMRVIKHLLKTEIPIGCYDGVVTISRDAFAQFVHEGANPYLLLVGCIPELCSDVGHQAFVVVPHGTELLFEPARHSVKAKTPSLGFV